MSRASGGERNGRAALAVSLILGFPFQLWLHASPQGKSSVFKWALVMLYFLFKMYIFNI